MPLTLFLVAAGALFFSFIASLSLPFSIFSTSAAVVDKCRDVDVADWMLLVLSCVEKYRDVRCLGRVDRRSGKPDDNDAATGGIDVVCIVVLVQKVPNNSRGGTMAMVEALLQDCSGLQNGMKLAETVSDSRGAFRRR